MWLILDHRKFKLQAGFMLIVHINKYLKSKLTNDIEYENVCNKDACLRARVCVHITFTFAYINIVYFMQISKTKVISESLIALEGTDLILEEAPISSRTGTFLMFFPLYVLY